MRPGLVIFDCDGVLVDSERLENDVMRRHLARHGLDWSLDRVMEAFVGLSMAEVEARAVDAGARFPEGWIGAFREEAHARLASEVEAISGVEAAVRAVQRAGCATCIASNGPPDKMAITLGRTGLAHLFAGRLFSAYEVGIAKPEPGLFLHAASALGFDAGQSVVIEDSPTGARAARRAGMRCFGYAADTPAESLRAEGAEVFTSMSDLPGLLGLAPAL